MVMKNKGYKKTSYQDLAKYYDIIYSNKNYKAEAKVIQSLIKKNKKSKGNQLLDVACGTGRHLPYLKDKYAIVAVDINKQMLAIARKNVPDVTYKQADMINFDLKQKFDVIICMFSSIGYVKNYSNLNKVFKNFSNHLNKGGVVIVEPYIGEDEYKQIYIDEHPTVMTYKTREVAISTLFVYKKRGMLFVSDLHFLIAEKNKKAKYAIEHHELAIFNTNKTLEIMKKHGLKAKFLPDALGKNSDLYIGVKT